MCPCGNPRSTSRTDTGCPAAPSGRGQRCPAGAQHGSFSAWSQPQCDLRGSPGRKVFRGAAPRSLTRHLRPPGELKTAPPVRPQSRTRTRARATAIRASAPGSEAQAARLGPAPGLRRPRASTRASRLAAAQRQEWHLLCFCGAAPASIVSVAAAARAARAAGAGAADRGAQSAAGL